MKRMKMEKAMRQKIRVNSDAGFSLVEVIIAITILALISLPLMKYFTDSMQYSARMERQQRATILAQEITEDLKGESDLLIRIPGGGTQYTVPYLTDPAMGYTVAADNLTGDGTGSIVLTKTDGNYDIQVTLSTATSGDNLIRPITYGIDNTKDMLAVEWTQTNEAFLYFKAVNAAYAASHIGATLTDDAIKARMNRVIHIDFSRNGADYEVCVYYDYTCTGLRGSGSTDSMTDMHLAEGRYSELSGIYLLYDKISEKDASGSDRKDRIVITKTAAVPLDYKPELYLICQNPQASVGYRLAVEGMTTGQKVYTNITPIDPTDPTAAGKGQVVNEYGNNVTTEPLADTDTPVRLVTIETEIYAKGHAAGDDPIAAVVTTKGE
ncbi:MAG: prepilin-type N-terminal cleavage/methylation domain-containing protein [Roseburia sp.]|nr:prepilin-type N-terminal cleavage/methylation domain-containing protein [Roseburia sp.]